MVISSSGRNARAKRFGRVLITDRCARLMPRPTELRTMSEPRDQSAPKPPADDLGLAPGDAHYRAYVGPPEDYDLVAAMTFNLMTSLGLRQHHRLLDIGCGSLRAGRLFIPYLNAGGYTGLEPNRWLVEDGIAQEVGADLVALKRPRFVFGDSAAALDPEDRFDFAVAQSIFSHAGLDLVSGWLRGMAPHLQPSGALAATFLVGEDCADPGWVYPGCVTYRVETMAAETERAGLRFQLLDWRHPRQTWALFAAPGHDTRWLEGRGPGWNAALDAGVWKPAS